jgi:NTE family protein
LTLPFAAVATALQTGAEIWLRRGSTLDAVRASIALPGLIAPVLHEDLVLVDGGLVNPVPVSLARAMGADVVVAVDLGSDLMGRHLRAHHSPQGPIAAVGDWIRRLQEDGQVPATVLSANQLAMPSLFEVVASSINIMQVRIARSRMAGEPPDVIVAPRLAHLRLLDFHRAKEAIDEGHRAVERVAHTLTFLQQASMVSGCEVSIHPERGD